MELQRLTKEEQEARKNEPDYIAQRTVEVGLGLIGLAFGTILFIVPVALWFYVLYLG